MLITDYSSIYIDYLLTEKPVVFLPYDKDDYLKDRGLNFKYDLVTPGPKPESFENFKNEVNRLLNDSSYYYGERHKINIFFNEINSECSPNICSLIKKDINKKNIISLYSFVIEPDSSRTIHVLPRNSGAESKLISRASLRALLQLTALEAIKDVTLRTN